MKKLSIFLLLSIFSFYFSVAQQVNNYILTENGKLKTENNSLSFNESGDQNVFITYKPNEELKDIRFSSVNKSQQNFDPGFGPEGDYMQAAKFSTDGSKLFVVNRQTFNVTVFDWNTMDIITNIPISNGGVNIDLNETTAVVTCLFDNSVTIINLSTYETVNVDVNENPANVKLHPNGNLAYVSCEINNVCDVIDLNTNTVIGTINNFPVYSQSLSWSSGSGRNFVKYNEFYFTAGGEYITVADNSNDLFKFFDANTYSLAGSVSVPGCWNVGISPDSSTVFTTSWDNNSAYRIDVASMSIIGNPVSFPDGPSGNTNIVCNPDGTKIYLGTNGNHGTLIDFADEEAVTFPSIYSAFWTGVSHDHQYVVHGNYNFAIVNFNTEAIEDIYPGNSQSFGAVSPTDYHVAAFDPLRLECQHFYDFTTQSNIIYRGASLPADNYEGDAPWRVEVTPNSEKAVMVNHLSQSVTIFDINNNVVDTILQFPMNGDIKNIAVTHNSEYALACFDDLNQTVIIDLISNEIVASVIGGGHTIRITPDDQYAYVSNIAGTDKINVIQLNGASSSFVTSINTGQMGINYAHYGIFSDIKIDPAGNYCVAAVSFEDKVKIIDISTNTIVQELSGFDFPLQLAFNNIGDKLAVTNMNGNTVSIIDFNGASSSIQGTYSCGNYPRRLEYNFFTNEFFVCNYDNNVVKIKPETGAITGTLNFSAVPVKIDFDLDGNSIVLVSSVPNQIINSSGEQYDIPYTAAYFYNNENDITAVVSPGLDNLSIINWSSSEGPHLVSTIPANGQNNVEINTVVSATFDIELTEIDLSGITITPDPGNVNASVSASAVTVIHDDFESETEYTVFIPAGSISDGTEPLAYDIEWSFTTFVLPTYSVTFYVHDQFDTPIDGAEVTVDGDIQYTNSSGEAYFNLPEGDVDYTVNTDYEQVSGVYTVTNENGQVADIEIIVGSISNYNKGISIYPNPSNGKFTIQFKNESPINNQITIIDITGKVIYKNNLFQNNTTVDITENEAGIYSLIIKNQENVYYYKLILN